MDVNATPQQASEAFNADAKVNYPLLLKQLREVHAVQGSDGNWNSARYMMGMFNGMELALAIMEGREPSFREMPEGGYLHEPSWKDFDGMLQHLLNFHDWDHVCNTQDFLLSEFLRSVLEGLKKLDERRTELRSAPDTVTITDGFGSHVVDYPMNPDGNPDDMAAAEAFRADYSSEEESLQKGTAELHAWKNDNPPSEEE